jgi:sigma-B regulation protein RsbU (phosphoserine phosphatase)
VKALQEVLERFERATGLSAIVWTQPVERGPLTVAAGSTSLPAPPIIEILTPGGPTAEVPFQGGALVVGGVPGHPRAWLGVGPSDNGGRERAAAFLAFLLPIVGHYFQSAMEVEHTAYELAERYEEINLLYTTSEILGRTVSLEEAAAQILEEISETVRARRAAILVHDRVTDTLQIVSALGFDARDTAPIATSDPDAVTARVFRDQRAVILEDGEMTCEAESRLRKGGLLAVPILWTNPTPHGSIPLGVVTLSERRGSESFSAGDEKLVSAIATQIGTAIQNARLVRASLAQQRLQQEMQLASDLQMKLLPDTSLFAPEARVAARVVPAESVGGDFYQLFRLGGGKTGVMIGDVASHGYRAALVMALVMSASSIHAQNTLDPAEMLSALLGTLRDELESTEMFISLFYAVIDPMNGRLRYANAGHPHAFVISGTGAVERLGALDPPLGMSADRPTARERAWNPMRDMLLLFTDGVSDARNRQDDRLGEEPILQMAQQLRSETPQTVVDRVFAAVRQHTGDAARRDDLTLLVLRS